MSAPTSSAAQADERIATRAQGNLFPFRWLAESSNSGLDRRRVPCGEAPKFRAGTHGSFRPYPTAIVLGQEQEVLGQLVFAERGRVALEMLGQLAGIADVLPFGGRSIVFEFDKLLEL